MSSPFADQPAALPQAPTIQILCSAPLNSPDCALVLDSTARTSSGATIPITREKIQLVQLFALAAVGFMVMHSYAMPPTPEPTENNQARIQHGGFLRDTFQDTASPSRSSPCPAVRADSTARQNKAGIRGSPCSPPSPCSTSCGCPCASVQMYFDLLPYHCLT